MMIRAFFIILTLIFASNVVAEYEKVTLQLRWDHQFQFAGYYAAKWQGFYEEEGLDVEIKSAVTPKGILSAVEEVSSERAHFGIGAADILMKSDRGIPLVVLASIFQHSASGFYTKKETRLNSPADFLNLKVARKVNDLIDIELQALLQAEGIDPGKIKPYPHQPGLEHLISGKVDVVPGYSIALPFEAQENGFKINTFSPIQYGIDFYGDSLFTLNALVEKDPKLIERFTKASLKGWEYALSHREQIAKKITETLPRTAKIGDLFAFNLYQGERIAKLMNFPVVETGHINPARWEKMHEYLKGIGVLKNPINIDEFIFNIEKLNRRKSVKHQKRLITAVIIISTGLFLTFLWVTLLRRTVSKKTEELTNLNKKLSESESHFRKMIEKSPLPTAIIDKHKNITFLNDKFTEHFKYTLDDISTTEKWLELAYPDENYRSKVQNTWRVASKKAITNQEEVEMQEWDVSIKDRTKRNCEFYIVPLKDLSLIVINDISERKQREIELQERKKEYSEINTQLVNIIESMPTAYIMWNTDSQIVEWNKAAEKIFLYSKEEIIGKNAVDYIVPEKIRHLVGNVLKELKIGQIAEYSERDNNIRKDGKLISCQWYNTPLADPSGNVYGFLTLAQDVTERLKTEENLQISEERFRSVAETAADAIISIDSQSKIIYWNKSAQTHFGYSAAEIIGKTISIIIPKRFQKDHYNGMERVLSGGESKIIGKTVEVLGLKKDNTQFPMELSLAKWKTGEDLYFTAIIRDISNRKETENILKENEEKFRSLFEHSPLAIVHLDKFGVITTCNENLCKILGAPRELIIGQNTTQNIDDTRMLNSIVEALSGHKSQYVGEYLSTTSGIQTPIRALYTPILSDDGEVTGVIGILEDITDQLATEQNKLELESQLRQLQKNEAIGALAGGIAHDFNNILFPIVGFAEMLKEDLPENSDFYENIDVILTGALRAKELVKQILTFSRQVEHDVKLLKPHLIINEVAKLTRSTIPASIEIKKFIDSEAWLIMADATQIHQVAMNLITNASYAMSKNGGTLTIRLQNIERIDIPDQHLELGDGPHILLSIGDTGIGMDETTLEKIFNPYFTSKPQGEGTGLGLSVVYGIIKNYGGDISVNSSIGQGTRFDVYIPAHIREKAIDQVHESVEITGGNERILLVDDEKQVLRTGQKILERLGYRVELNENSLDALNIITNKPDYYDLVITDMSMPNLTGDQLTQKIMKIKPAMPIIICTGFSERITMERVQSIGAKTLLMKPIIKSKLAITVRDVLDKVKKDINVC